MPQSRHEDSVVSTSLSPKHNRKNSVKILARNIDKVLLGDLLFDSWYFSPYPDQVLFGPDHHASKPATLQVDVNGYGNVLPATTPKPLIDLIHVCPYCFKYTIDAQGYVSHVKSHIITLERNEELPLPETAEKVYEWDGYTVWDVDGETEKLYCQNLSLFAKLFLEQKSVFFDTSGFHYYVLTRKIDQDKHTASEIPSSRHDRGVKLQHQVLGFFSKENLSWDSNNLACILIFPPHQHRNLGQLLMAVSYKLSGWEWEGGVIGGPEKPLSVMGRKSYLRFWSERIARHAMGMTRDAEGKKVFEGKEGHDSKVQRHRASFVREVMTVKELGLRTGMLSEDVAAALLEMGICESIPVKRSQQKAELEMNLKSIKRSSILAWARDHQVDLIGPVKEEGYLGEWAMSERLSRSP